MAISRAKWTGRHPSFTRDHRAKTRLYLHHTVSPNRKWTAAQERAHLRQLEQGHLNQGWTGIGYSYLLFPSGRLYEGRGPNAVPAAQVNANSGSIAIAYVGNTETADMTGRAKARFVLAARNLKRAKGITYLGGHRDAPGQSTACPGRRAYGWLGRAAKLSGLRRL